MEAVKRIDTVVENLADHLKDPPVRPGSPVAEFAPLVDRAPELLAASIEQVFEATAQRAERIADELMQVAIERKAEAQEFAAVLRQRGKRYALAVSGACDLIRTTAGEMNTLKKRVVDFRLEEIKAD